MVRRLIFTLAVCGLTLPAAASQVQHCYHRDGPPLAAKAPATARS